MKISSVLSCKFPQVLCRHRRITVAPNFTSQLGFCPFCRLFSARLCHENRRRDMDGRNFCLNRVFSATTCTFQSSSVSGAYFILIQKMCYFPQLSAIPSPCHPSPETIPKHWYLIHLCPSATMQRNNRYSERLIVVVYDHPSLRLTKLSPEAAVNGKGTC